MAITTEPAASLSRPRLLLLALLLLLLLAALTWANFNYLNAPAYAHRDFMSLWGGGRAILMDLDPYDPAVWRPLRAELGSKWLTGDRGNPFPLWTILFVLPLALLPVGWAAAIWLTLSQTLFCLSLFLLATVLSGRKPAVAEFTLLVVGAFTFRATLVTLHNGQITLVLLTVLTLFLFFLQQERPFTAGFVLAFIILKPNPFILFAPLLALWLLWQRRWRVIGGGATAALLMLALSWLVLPGWLLRWQTVREKTAESIRSFIMPTFWGLGTEISIDWAPLIGAALAIILTAALGWYIFRRPALSAVQVSGLAIAASLLVTPYAWAYEHALLLLPLIMLFFGLERRWLAWLLWIGMVFLLPWLMYRASEGYGRGTLELVIPLAALTAYWALLARFPTGSLVAGEEDQVAIES